MTTENPSRIALATETVAPTMVRPLPTAAPHASVEVIWFNAETETREMRFLAVIHNSSSQTIEGLETRWDALDARGARIESMPSKSAALPPGDSYFTGSMLALASPIPASVMVTITDPGRLTSGESSRLSVGEVVFQPTRLRNQYTVTASVTTGSAALEPARLLLVLVGFDAGGKVVGVNFGFPSLPSTVPPNTTIRATSFLRAPDGTPAKVEVYATVNLELPHTEIIVK